ncbi:chemotaxis protein CheW [Rossellomorea vietnamensis]|jgi:purine-binding chemotaxis protein CheW|uniref:Chemotaxis protein CheW n=1 Tax=Rossellomorea vietnamensis TaxID=218284 RepID=A0A6I6UPZ2_9BACI|nr:chemotaxis protein CheW [Rossellomorea vietnamensis]OXS63235.1 chemotaxis protein CheW [Bacillus sp. DSM 27956]PRX78197.1 purine-binding chemotaxis protein CheW [Bacillus sp. V-88]MCA0148613.1 chemotaxis protein CheW [Rossellomorea vietnamensis]MCC5802792.1 chemotaxis protein CheW [Rossellomorea vietnamensis]QHE61311.1 chemotaxis protein CheW [Rossellomorea vietnamensis]
MSEIIDAVEDLKLIVFQLVDKEYAIPVHQVRSIEKLEHITRVPRTASYVKGVINLRGVVTPIIDLRSRFDLPVSEPTDSTRVIIAGLEDKEVGLIVDAANDVLDVARESIEPSPEVVGVVEAEYIGGVVKQNKRLLIILHLDKILQSI